MPERERRRRQPIELDLALEMDLGDAARTDDVRRTADYAAVERSVRAAVEGAEFRLLERLAMVAAQAALAADRRVRAADVRAVKRPGAMPRTRQVAVELRLTRANDVP